MTMLNKAVLWTLMCVLTLHLSLASPTSPESQLEQVDDVKVCHNITCQGMKGDTGPQGPPGERGPQGFCDATSCESLDGRQGEQGPAGEKGEKGEPGKDGMDGPAGPRGPTGSPGRKGIPGAEGMKGMKGDPGMVGPPGQRGAVGKPGVPGRAGPPGKRGLPGNPGPPGVNGRDGADGEKGERGEPGSTVEVKPRFLSGSCNESLQGVIRFDPTSKQLYYCDGTDWVCIQTAECQGPAPTCPSPLGPQQIGDQWYQVFVQNVTQATQDAADIVLVVDESGSMTAEQDWLLVMVPLLENVLIANGVGDGEIRNRYCLVGFGSFGNLRPGHFRPVNGQPCFSAAEFSSSQSQLIAAGLREDGYQAIKFALDNVPFRDSPFIAKNVILVTDEGRTIIPEGEGITRESIEAELKANDILLNVVVFADYELEAQPNRTVIGVDARGKSFILEPEGQFSISEERVLITQAEKNTAEAYVDLAVSVGGAAWALRVLRESSINRNVDIQMSFTSALTEIKLREIQAVIESCRKCTCVASGSGESATQQCSVAQDEIFCRCVVENQGDESKCESGLVDPDGGDERVSGSLITPRGTITSIERAPDFVELDVLIHNP